jgi:hypothetical protein
MVIFASQLSLNYAMGDHINCTYGTWSRTQWPETNFCKVTRKRLYVSDINESYTFSGTSEEKQGSEAIVFRQSPVIEFIPISILSEFHWFLHQRIQSLESDAFINLPDLKWINLFGNQLEIIATEIFNNNGKLEFINLHSNRIKTLNPNLFSNLKSLSVVWLDMNECINENFGVSYQSLTILQDALENCYTNCFNDEECAANVPSTTTSATTTTETLSMFGSIISFGKKIFG